MGYDSRAAEPMSAVYPGSVTDLASVCTAWAAWPEAGAAGLHIAAAAAAAEGGVMGVVAWQPQFAQRLFAALPSCCSRCGDTAAKWRGLRAAVETA